MDCFDTTSSRRAWLITGTFGLKFSPSGFAILLTRWNRRPISAQWARCSKGNGRKWRPAYIRNAVTRKAMRPRIAFVSKISLLLLTGSWHRDDELAVLLGDEVLGAAR